MTRAPARPGAARRLGVTLGAAAAALVAHEALARALDAAGLVERLLAPSGTGVVLAFVAGVALLALRVGVIFVLPGWVLARLVALAVSALRGRGASGRAGGAAR